MHYAEVERRGASRKGQKEGADTLEPNKLVVVLRRKRRH